MPPFVIQFLSLLSTYRAVSVSPRLLSLTVAVAFVLRVKEKERRSSIVCRSKEKNNYGLIYKETEGKPNADCQSRSPMPSASAEPSSSPWGQARPMGAVSHRPHARARQHQTLGKPPGQIPTQQFVFLFYYVSFVLDRPF